MAAATEQKINEWKGDPLEPETVWEGGEEVFDGSVRAECPEAGEVAIHVTREGADDPISSLYMTPAQAYLHAERIRTAAWIAEKLGVKDA
jgi:hypothetical protein